MCSKCSNELPRCCLCLNRLGCNNRPTYSTYDVDRSEPHILLLSKAPNEPTASEDDYSARPLYSLRHFDSWTAWCNKCHHAGHAAHMREWFRHNSKCPVTGCECACASHDAYLLATPAKKP